MSVGLRCRLTQPTENGQRIDKSTVNKILKTWKSFARGVLQKTLI
ncbi:MAG: hypothetical protein ACK47Y_11005 [Dolichospermum sp.]